MTNPIPNSPKFSRLSAGLQRRILEQRAIAAGQVTMAEIWNGEREAKPEAEDPGQWYYEPNAKKALMQWSEGKKTNTTPTTAPRCISKGGDA